MKRAFLLMALSTALLQLHAFGQSQQPEPVGAAPAASAAQAASTKKTTLESSDVTTKANGQIELVLGRDSPIFSEFQGSPALTQRLRDSLQARGFELAPDASSSKATLQFRGDIVLMGC